MAYAILTLSMFNFMAAIWLYNYDFKVTRVANALWCTAFGLITLVGGLILLDVADVEGVTFLFQLGLYHLE